MARIVGGEAGPFKEKRRWAAKVAAAEDETSLFEQYGPKPTTRPNLDGGNGEPSCICTKSSDRQDSG